MKLDVISHCTIDTIEINDSKFVVPGGPGCYCSLTARSLKFDVKLHTKFLKIIKNIGNLRILIQELIYLK